MGACALHSGYLRLQTHYEYVLHFAFPLQEWLHERASVLLYITLPVLFPVSSFMSATTTPSASFVRSVFQIVRCCQYNVKSNCKLYIYMNSMCSVVTVTVVSGNAEGDVAALSVSDWDARAGGAPTAVAVQPRRYVCVDALRNGAGRSTRGVQ